MKVLDCARVIIYRINQKGLEIFLVNTQKEGQEAWGIIQGNLASQHTDSLTQEERVIELDPVKEGESLHQALAIECDWHEIPSIRAMIKEDVRIVKKQIKLHIPELEQGTFFAVKEAFKKVLPHEYAMLKELKDVLVDRNQSKYI
jgi:predicted NUDIX family NTP pyrophosphohydrolase